LDASAASAKEAAPRPTQPPPRRTWPLLEQTKADEVFAASGITPSGSDARPTSAMTTSSLADHDDGELHLSEYGADILRSYVSDCDPKRLVVCQSSSSSSSMFLYRPSPPAPHVPAPPSSSGRPPQPQLIIGDIYHEPRRVVG
jgi:hypothetical protein